MFEIVWWGYYHPHEGHKRAYTRGGGAFAACSPSADEAPPAQAFTTRQPCVSCRADACAKGCASCAASNNRATCTADHLPPRAAGSALANKVIVPKTPTPTEPAPKWVDAVEKRF